MSSLKDLASLIMVPSLVKDGRLDTVKPLGNSIIHPDATGNNDGTDGSTPAEGNFTFSRGSNLAATRVDVNGLIEKGRENLLLQSNQFDTTWFNINTTETGGQSGYDGSSNAWLIDINGGVSSQYIGQNISVSGVQTFSVYAKAGSKNWIMFLGTGSTIPQVYFDLQNGVVGTESNATGEIVSVGNGWYRCSMWHNQTIGSLRMYIATADNDITQSSGNIYIQDAQLESSMVATDYIETGASTAQAGILEDLPRLDYSGGASCPALLLEPQRTNFVTNSEYFNSWSKTGVGVIQNAIQSPEGLMNAVKIVENTGTSVHKISLSNLYVVGAGNDNYLTLYAKEGERRYLAISSRGNFTNNDNTLIFDTRDGVWTHNVSGQNTGQDPINMGDGWWKINLLNPSTSAAYDGYGIGLAVGPDNWSYANYTGDGSSGIYVYGAQAEAGSYPTSYIPTMGSAVTRSKDFMSNTNNLLSGLDNMCWFIDYTLTTESTSGFRNEVGYRDNSNANLYMVQFPNSNTHEFRYTGVAGVNVDMTPSIDEATYGLHRKIVYLKRGTTLKVFCNGVEVSTTTNASATTFSTTDENLRIGNNYPPELDVHQFLVFPTALTDSECIALTTL